MGFLDDHKTLAIATVAATGGALALWTISSHRRRQWPTPATTDFDSFLRKPIDNPSLQHQKQKKKKNNYAATSFEAYLTKNESSSSQLLKTGNDETAAHIVEAAPCCCPPDAKPVTIFYGTEFGFSREIAEKLCHSIENYTTSNVNSDNKYWPELLNLADFPDGVSCLDRCQVVLLASSTQGDGVPPTEVRDFCSWLFGPTAPRLSSLQSSSSSLTTAPPSTSGGVKFSVLALGDRSYTHFARCGKTIDARLEELGGQRFLPRVDVNKEDMVVVDAWIESVVAELDNLNLQTAESLGWNGVRASLFNTLDSTTSTNEIASETKWSKSRPYFASVNKVESLCNLTNSSATTTATTPNGTNSVGKNNTNNIFSTNINDKNTVRVELDLGSSGIEYLPGDALGVWPKNDPQDVEDLLDAAGFSCSQMMMTHNNELISDNSGSIEKLMAKVPVWHYKDEEISNNVHGGDYNSFSSSSSSTAINGGLISLRDALTRCYDLKTPKPELMQLLAKKLAVLKQKYEEEDTPSLANNSRCGNGNGILSGESDVQRNTHSTIITNGSTYGITNGSHHEEGSFNSTTTVSPVDKNVDRLSSLLKELTNNKDLLEKYLSARHIADILRDWKPARLTIEELLSVLRQLQPRLYSISSSPLEDTSSSIEKENTSVGDGDNSGSDGSSEETQRPHTVQLTVAVLHYKSAVGKPRVGVASTYLAERAQEQQQQQQLAPSSPPMQEGQKKIVFQQNSSRQSRVPVYLYKNPDFRLPADLKTPIIMVGPGTGVAPFRGFIQHRILLAKAAAAAAAETERKEKVQRLQNLPKDGHVEGTDEKHGEDKLLEKQEAAVGPALLFFGSRRRDEDYLYGTELESWANEGHIRLYTAFSRETDKKIYVQHRLVENGELVWQLLEAGAVFYVCGDGAHMAGDVESALKSIIEKYQGQGYAAAVQYFGTMVKTGHYKKDVWTS